MSSSIRTIIIIMFNWLFTYANGHVDTFDNPQEISFFHDLGTLGEENWAFKELIKLHNVNPGSVLYSNAEILSLGNLEAVDGGFYKLKSIVKTSKGNENVFYSSMKVDSLTSPKLLSRTVIHLDQNGSILSIKLHPKIHQGFKLSNNATIIFKGSEPGPVPDLTSYLIKLEREREAKEKGGNQDNRSFISKYWMYIVPLVIFAVITATNSDGGAQQGR